MTEKRGLWIADQGDGTYRNPILYTDYSDPDVAGNEGDYYMAASSFSNSPALPILHSKDLVNWKVVSYVMEKIPFPDYNEPAHGRGVWAPAIRFHEGKYYVYFPMPDEGIFVSTCENPKEGGWSEPVCVKEGKGWIDPCPLWDEDGKAYLVNAYAKSRIGIKSILHISPMAWDGMSLLGDGADVFDGHNTQPTIEGPKLYKRTGYYYILAPAGGVKTGWQTALRSKNIYGPYEEKIVMLQGDTQINGPHQGGWITTQTGEDWFLHFQDVENAGRIVHLQPMTWENDWPVIGRNTGEGYGVPVEAYKKPDVGGEYPIGAPEDSDDFRGKSLGLQWQWNANYKDEWYSLSESGLTLYAKQCQKPLCDVPNLLLQKWTAPAFYADTLLRLKNLKDGDIVGMISLGTDYTAIAIEQKGNQRQLVQITGIRGESEEKKLLGSWEESEIAFRMKVDITGHVQFFIKKKGAYESEGNTVLMTPGRWVGVKCGLFAINQAGSEGGSVEADSFLFS
ncbi:glycoside hydrolase family 43 protein [Konateibacter massiliensis]|uniref:glycoside hydrolase family 43 protein n=1 Tax=Konateibacter massiliensis TaxID=2002841 RepID=UPI000C15C1DE|nr:glycoside hydrolase 43 family protein [Konateibacter massiliensis]